MSTDSFRTTSESPSFEIPFTGRNIALTPPARVENRPGFRINVGDDERLVSLIAGGVLAGIGMGTRGLTSLTMLGLGGGLIYRAVTGHCHLYNRLSLSSSSGQAGVRPGHGVRVVRSLHLSQSPEKVSETWGELTNLPNIMRHLEKVEKLDGKTTHWVAKSLGMTFEWDAETTEYTRGKSISFRSLPGGDIDTEGTVKFEASPQGGTVLRVEMSYDPPAGAIGDNIARLFGANLEAQIDEDLRRFKQTMESGSVPTTKGQAKG